MLIESLIWHFVIQAAFIFAVWIGASYLHKKWQDDSIIALGKVIIYIALACDAITDLKIILTPILNIFG